MTALVASLLAALFGLFIGSFAGATVWRLRARQLAKDKADGEQYDKKELAKLEDLSKQSVKNDRSRCLHCKHQLAWYDLIPLVSWFSTKGQCRYCKKPIGRFEPAVELLTAATFGTFTFVWVSTMSISAWPLFILWLVALTMLVILFAYDAKWFLLPDVIVFPLIAIAAVIAVWQATISGDGTMQLWSTLGAVLLLGGLYLMLWLVSKGMWVGFGDVKLGLALGLLLGDWQLAFLTLLLSNLIGTLIVIPGLLSGKMTRKTQVPFGPLLITGFFISLVAGFAIIDAATGWIESLTGVLLML